MCSALLLFFPLAASAAELRIAVASSLADVVAGRCAAFASLTPGLRCVISKGGSGVLARQIEQGAPVDLFISAHPEWIDSLVSKGLLNSTSVVPLVGNRLVFVGAPGSARSVQDLARLRRIALGNPANVPAGTYAEAVLRRAGLYTELLQQGRLVFTQDVRQALVYAERGEVDGAFVYRSDALQGKKVVTLFEIPVEQHPAIVVPMALTGVGYANSEARAFWSYLRGPASVAAFEAAGFLRP